MKDGDVSLILKDVTINDAETYECYGYMEETHSWELISIIYLRVSPDQKTITVESGQDVTLTCRAPNNNIRVVEWRRADLKNEYLLLYRDGHPVPYHQHPSFKNRVDLQDRQMKDGDVSLILKDVTINDAGTYECYVLMAETNSWKLISFISLSVAVPPERKLITAESGQDVTLTCRAPNIRRVYWSRDDLLPENVFLYQHGRFDPDNQHPSFENRVDLQDRQMKDGDMSLILKDVSINDGGTYECYGFMAETHSWKLISIIYLRVSPVQKTITAESGQDVTLTCQAPHNKIRAVEWSRADLKNEYLLLYRDRHFVPDDQHPSFKNRVDLKDRQMKDGDVSLILKDVMINDAETYECYGFMAETHSWKLISSISLSVVDPPDPKIITAESGQDVTLTCRAPKTNIRHVYWSRDDLLPENVFLYQHGRFNPDNQHPSFKNRVDLHDRQMKDGDVSLNLKDVTINDAGTYECHVYMEETHSWKLISIIYLRVSPERKIITAESGKDVTLTCRAPNNSIITVHWSRADLKKEYLLLYQDGHFVPDSQHPSFKNRVELQDRQMKDGDVSLILKDVTVNDAETYKCYGFMAETHSWELISFISLTVVVPPDQTEGDRDEL
uniref:Ig-like domain-containing protein n=1 Tax=Oreochromis niloticus TaxID=8128 RepID=I3JC62_ORENI